MMSSVKVIFVFLALVASICADDDREKDHAIFRECAEANGLKKGGEFKRGERPTGPPPPEMLCTVKCTMEKKGLLVDGKIQTEEARNDPKMLHHISADKMDGFMDCLKTIQVNECADIEKVMDCEKAAMG